MLTIPKDSMRNIYLHCEEKYPEEACGFIHLSGIIHCGENIQNRLHAMDSNTYLRDATQGYTFSIKDLKLLDNSMNTDDPVVSIYHSHPDVGAYFSKEDKEKALFQGKLIHPVSFLVVDVKNKSACGGKLFKYTNPDFTCINEYDEFGDALI